MNEAQSAVSLGSGAIAYPTTGNVANSVIPLPDGVQMLTTIASTDAPTSFPYALDASDAEVSLELLPDGSAAVKNVFGDVLFTTALPWAVDAAGAHVPTHYEVDGMQLTQVVDHLADDFHYPIVADPTWVGSTAYYSKTEVREMKKVLDNINAFCHYVPLKYVISVACQAPAAMEDAIRRAYYQGKRLAATYHSCGYNYCSYYTYKVVT